MKILKHLYNLSLCPKTQITSICFIYLSIHSCVLACEKPIDINFIEPKIQQCSASIPPTCSPSKKQSKYLAKYSEWMKEQYPAFSQENYDFNRLEKIFERLRDEYTIQPSKVISNLKKFAKMVDTPLLTRELLKDKEAYTNLDDLFIDKTHYALLFRLLLEPTIKKSHDQPNKFVYHKSPQKITNAIPVLQERVVMSDATIPLTTGGVYDCVAIYGINTTVHGLVHYDLWCHESQLEELLKYLQNGDKNYANIQCSLLSVRFTTQIQKIYYFLTKLGIFSVNIFVFQPNHFQSQQPEEYTCKKDSYTSHIHDGEYSDLPNEVEITCCKGEISYGVTKNTLVSHKSFSKHMNEIIENPINNSLSYMNDYYDFYKDKSHILPKKLEYYKVELKLQ